MKETYDDFIGCCVQSLNDGYADYCFKPTDIGCIKSRLRKEGKTSAFVVNRSIGDFKCWQMFPINIYKQILDDKNRKKEIEVRYLVLTSDKIDKKYKITFKTDDTEFTLKDYDNDIDKDLLMSIALYTNNLNL